MIFLGISDIKENNDQKYNVSASEATITSACSVSSLSKVTPLPSYIMAWLIVFHIPSYISTLMGHF